MVRARVRVAWNRFIDGDQLMRRLLTLAFALALLPTLTSAQRSADQDVAQAIVRECLAIYHEGRPCACPSDLARNGSRCGKRSAYDRPGGAKPRCYVSDVSPAEIAAYRAGKKTFVEECEPLP
jgi:hypothetical protein